MNSKLITAIFGTVTALALAPKIALADESTSVPAAASDQFVLPVTLRPKAIAKSCVAPSYPPESVREGESGLSTLNLLIDSGGTVIDGKVSESSGFYRLDEAALEALRRCKFNPAKQDGETVKAWVKLEYLWILSDSHGRPLVAFAYDNQNGIAKVPSRDDWFAVMWKSYDRLPVQYRERVRAFYDATKIDDEPPYPEKGLGALYFPLSKAQGKRMTVGLLAMHITVGADGNAVTVSVLASPDQQIQEIAEKAAMNIKFKPAKCGGISCLGIFPLRLAFNND